MGISFAGSPHWPLDNAQRFLTKSPRSTMVKSESSPPLVTCWPCILRTEGAASAIRNMPVCAGYRQDYLGMSELPSILVEIGTCFW